MKYPTTLIPYIAGLSSMFLPNTQGKRFVFTNNPTPQHVQDKTEELARLKRERKNQKRLDDFAMCHNNKHPLISMYFGENPVLAG